MPSRFATRDWLVLSTRRCLKAMPSLAAQYTRIHGFIGIFTVVRLLTSLKMSYEAPKKRASRIQDHGRVTAERRETVQLVQQAVSKGRHAYVLVNIRSDGTVQASSEVLRTQRMFSLSEPGFQILKT